MFAEEGADAARHFWGIKSTAKNNAETKRNIVKIFKYLYDFAFSMDKY